MWLAIRIFVIDGGLAVESFWSVSLGDKDRPVRRSRGKDVERWREDGCAVLLFSALGLELEVGITLSSKKVKGGRYVDSDWVFVRMKSI